MPERLQPRQVLLITLLLTLAAGLVRFYRCDESVHPDTLLWLGLTRKFWEALKSGNFADTYQVAHPGVTLMWLSGICMKLNGSFVGPVDPASLFALKLPGTLVGTLAASLTFPLAIACLGQAQWRPALVLAALLTSEPFLIEQSRMGQLDMPALGFAWLGLWVSIIAYERDDYRAALGAGALFGAAVLSKLSLAPLPATLMLVLGSTTLLSRFRDKRGLKVAALVTLAAVVTCFVLWPALWTSPRHTLQTLIHENTAMAAHGHAHTINGVRTSDPGASFYWNWVIGVTPIETVLLAVLGLATIHLVRPIRKHYLWLALSLIPYLVVICLAHKKLTRYVLPAAPLLLLFASAALEWLASRLQHLRRRAPLALAAAFALLFVGRYARAVSLLPSAQQSTSWPGQGGRGRPADMYFMHDLALVIRDDWRGRSHRMPPRVYVDKPQLMSPWLVVKRPKSAGRADYVVVWDEAYVDADVEAGKLTPRAESTFGKLGPVITTVRYSGRIVAQLHRGGGEN